MEEHAVLMGAYARAQERCTRLVREQAVQIEALQGQVMRLHAALVLRDSAMALVREELGARAERGPSLSRRLLGLLQVGRGRTRLAAPAVADGKGGLQEKAVLCIAEGEAASELAQQLVEIAGGRYLHQRADILETADEAAIEASLRAADLVICQTGCVSHGAWWRVQDHCRRTGKPCVLIGGQAQPVQWLRPVQDDAAALISGG
ncbi:DUF2325 domain-containing protein [Xenophilus arseniciresistens]|uniref:DUF2325 domain-containing protein n=1 Tax=Xenophilus arseniciresistens TaxID=1283306 RepID=A0AAE3NAR4_9BURK|nr:DUF2325 domain-containing protein [Xenophilus arseniciresistens]MDA7416847.1 DUF2325 domain-containing protein [Xenophilus arseniciresistens]